jgi:ABC-type arginine transport system permease subunit
VANNPKVKWLANCGTVVIRVAPALVVFVLPHFGQLLQVSIAFAASRFEIKYKIFHVQAKLAERFLDKF